MSWRGRKKFSANLDFDYDIFLLSFFYPYQFNFWLIFQARSTRTEGLGSTTALRVATWREWKKDYLDMSREAPLLEYETQLMNEGVLRVLMRGITGDRGDPRGQVLLLRAFI